MQLLRLCLVFSALLCGCSVLIKHCGEDLQPLTTRDKVHERFGEPSRTGIVDGLQVEEFRSRCPVYDEGEMFMHGMSLGYTFGLAELYLFPRDVFCLMRRVITGRPEIGFTYDSAGKVVGITISGHAVTCAKVVNAKSNGALSAFPRETDQNYVAPASQPVSTTRAGER